MKLFSLVSTIDNRGQNRKNYIVELTVSILRTGIWLLLKMEREACLSWKFARDSHKMGFLQMEPIKSVDRLHCILNGSLL